MSTSLAGNARWLGVCVTALLLCGCPAAGSLRTAGTGAARDATVRLAEALPGDYDNHEQATRKTEASRIERVQHELRAVDTSADTFAWLWRVRVPGRNGLSGVWLMRAHASGSGALQVVPYRALDSAAADAAFADPARFRFVAAQWAELAPCALGGAWQGETFAAAASVEACSALLPGLGETAALLPLRFSIAGDQLQVATFSDQAQGANAIESARRVRWFEGWAAINGGGPQASAANADWHFDRALRISSEGGRVSLRWRDGSASGYSLELERTTYVERKLAVLQLNLIDDRSGSVVAYAWTDPRADAIGLNLGWLQVGLDHPAPKR